MKTTNDERRTTILYLDTSDEIAVISLHRGDDAIASTRWHAGQELSKTLSQKYSHILPPSPKGYGRTGKNVGISSKDIAGICIFVGPGSFTGLRIGVSFANALAFGLGIPIYEAKEKRLIDFSNPQEVATPFYGAEPKITKPKNKTC